MTRPRRKRQDATEALAREAARLLTSGNARDVNEATSMAAKRLGEPRAPRPSPLQVRRHAQAMTMQAVGEAHYSQQRSRWLAIAEEVMAAIEHALPDSRTQLAGRAAAGHFDGDPSMHIRVLSDASITDIVQRLASLGYDDPECRFTTMHSRHGRLSQAQWVEEGARIVLTRCPQPAIYNDPCDLVTGRPTPRLTREQLRGDDAGGCTTEPASPES